MKTQFSVGRQVPAGAGVKFTMPVSDDCGLWSPAVMVSVLPSTTHRVWRPSIAAARPDGPAAAASVICRTQTGPGSAQRVALAQFAEVAPSAGFQSEQSVASSSTLQTWSQEGA